MGVRVMPCAEGPPLPQSGDTGAGPPSRPGPGEPAVSACARCTPSTVPGTALLGQRKELGLSN